MSNQITVDDVLGLLETEMHSHLESPVKGDLMSLTRAWREILDDFQVKVYFRGRKAEREGKKISRSTSRGE